MTKTEGGVMRIMVKKPGEGLEVVQIDGDEDSILDALKAQVGGYIELLSARLPVVVEAVAAHGVHCYGNEDAKHLGLARNVPIIGWNGFIHDWIRGPIIFSASNADGEEIGLSEEQMNAVKELFAGESVIAL